MIYVIAFCLMPASGLHAAGAAKSTAKPHASRQTVVARIDRFVCNSDNETAWWLTLTAERKIIEWLANAGVEVQSEFTSRKSKFQPLCRIGGTAGYQDSVVSLKLRMTRDSAPAKEAHIAAKESEVRSLRNVLGEIIVYGLDIDRHTLQTMKERKKPTQLLYAFGLYLLAKRAYRAGKTEKAIALLEDALRADTTFAMACWTIGTMYQKQKKKKQSAQWFARAESIDSAHLKWSFADPAVGEYPLDSLLARSRNMKLRKAAAGLWWKNVHVAQCDLRAVIWKVNPQKHAVDICMQAQKSGSLIAQLHTKCKALISLNAGFFEIDRSYHLVPSGLVVCDGRQVAAQRERGGSGIFFMHNGQPGIMWSKDYDTVTQWDMALQCGPVIVEPGGTLGVYSNNYKRANRSAIGITADKDEVVLIAVAGAEGRALSLYEFAQFLCAPPDKGGCGCDVALNLDGGSSTQMRAHVGKARHSINGLWAINNALVVKKR